MGRAVSLIPGVLIPSMDSGGNWEQCQHYLPYFGGTLYPGKPTPGLPTTHLLPGEVPVSIFQVLLSMWGSDPGEKAVRDKRWGGNFSRVREEKGGEMKRRSRKVVNKLTGWTLCVTGHSWSWRLALHMCSFCRQGNWHLELCLFLNIVQPRNYVYF